MAERLKLAIQKSGRLSDKTFALLAKSGIEFDAGKDRLLQVARDFPLEVMLVRDDDIPAYVADGVCHLGIVGDNVVQETVLRSGAQAHDVIQVAMRLNFGKCRLSIAVPEHLKFGGLGELNGGRIASSYPYILKRFLATEQISASVIELSGSVEIAPSLKIADAICDLVSSGSTLRSNGLKEVATILESQALLVRTSKTLSPVLSQDLDRLMQRFDGVIRAAESKYIMMNAHKDALPDIRRILPGMEEPSIMYLGGQGDRIAIHAVARESIFWETIEKLKAIGATSILVLPIEKVVV